MSAKAQPTIPAPNVASLPSMEHSFSVQVKGVETGLNWVGNFKYKRPSLGARGRIDVMRANLCGDREALLPEVIEFHEMVAYLRHTLSDYPEWWKEANFGLDLYDGNVVSEVYAKAMEFEAEWKTKVFGGDAKSVEAKSDAGDQAATAGAVSP